MELLSLPVEAEGGLWAHFKIIAFYTVVVVVVVVVVALLDFSAPSQLLNEDGVGYCWTMTKPELKVE